MNLETDFYTGVSATDDSVTEKYLLGNTAGDCVLSLTGASASASADVILHIPLICRDYGKFFSVCFQSVSEYYVTLDLFDACNYVFTVSSCVCKTLSRVARRIAGNIVCRMRKVVQKSMVLRL